MDDASDFTDIPALIEAINTEPERLRHFASLLQSGRADQELMRSSRTMLLLHSRIARHTLQSGVEAVVPSRSVYRPYAPLQS